MVNGCAALLEGRAVDDDLVLALGGPHARHVLSGQAREDQEYWLRVWAARGLLWAWDDTAFLAVVAALDDEQWRVREMACKVVARHRLGEALEAVAPLQNDRVARVRAAAARAVSMLTAAGA